MRCIALAAVVLLAGASHAQDAPLPPLGSVRLLRQARILETAGEVTAARDKLAQAVDAFPEELAPLIAFVEHLERNGSDPEELARLRAILTARFADPESPVPRGTLDYLALNADIGPEEQELVLAAVRSRLAAAPDDLALLRAAVLLQQRLGRPADAHATLVRMIELAPTVDLLLRAVDYERDIGDWGNAAKHLETLLDGHQASPFVRLAYIDALGRAGEYDKLLATLDTLGEAPAARDPQVVEGQHASGTATPFRDPAMADALNGVLFEIAWELRDRGRADEAETIFRRILAADAEHAGARQAVLYLYSTDEERRAHQAALESKWAGEEDPYALFEEGAKLLASGDDEEAFALISRAAPALPDNELIYFNLGLAAIRLERWAEAAAAFERAITLNPGRARSFLNRGIALQSLERFDEAIAMLDRSLAMQPELFQAHYYLYESYRRKGDDAKAREHLARYQAAAPN